MQTLMHIAWGQSVMSRLQDAPVLVSCSFDGLHLHEVRLADDSEGATHQLVSLLGTPFLTHLPALDSIVSGQIARDGFWEAAESQFLLSVLRPGMTVLDVGANIGYYAVLLARALGTTGRVYAFEPEPRNFAILAANMQINAELVPNAAPIAASQCAIADREGVAALSVFQGNLGFHSLEVSAPDGARLNVPVHTLDRLRWCGAPPERGIATPVSLLKADIQAGELRMLRGAAKMLEHDKPLLCLECEPYLRGEETALQLVGWLREHGYTQFRVFHSDRREPQPILAEFVRLLSYEDVRKLITSKRIGAYGTLVAFPDTVSP
jgi:FkbM family methyltransferase